MVHWMHRESAQLLGRDFAFHHVDGKQSWAWPRASENRRLLTQARVGDYQERSEGKELETRQNFSVSLCSRDQITLMTTR